MGEANFYYFTCLKDYPIDSSLRSWRRHSLPLRWRFCALSSSLPAPFLAVTPVPSIWTTVRRVFPAMRWSPVLRRRRGLAKKATAGCRNVFAPERRRRKICPCPKNSHPGLWEVPMVYYQDEQKPPSVCTMIDACHDNGTKQSAYDLLLNNFLRHYLTNRAPFPMFMHAG